MKLNFSLVIIFLVMFTSCKSQTRDIVVIFSEYPFGDYWAYGKGNTSNGEDTIKAVFYNNGTLPGALEEVVFNKTGKWVLMNHNTLLSIYTYKNDSLNGYALECDDEGNPIESVYMHGDDISMTDTICYYFRPEIKKNTIMCQMVSGTKWVINNPDIDSSLLSLLDITGKKVEGKDYYNIYNSAPIINLWDSVGNKLVDNRKHMWIDYYGEIKKKIGVRPDTSRFTTMKWFIFREEFPSYGSIWQLTRHNDDYSYRESYEFISHRPYYYTFIYKEPDDTYHFFYITSDYYKVTENYKEFRAVECTLYSCDSILFRRYDISGTLMREEIIDYNHLTRSEYFNAFNTTPSLSALLKCD